MTRVLHQDLIPEFIPETEVKLVILGTMASFIARSIDAREPASYFYYHNNKNLFWGALSLLYYGEIRKFQTIQEKKDFLNLTGIAVSNLVSYAELNDGEKSEDKFLFKAYEEKRLGFKTVSNEFKGHLQNSSVFFTCYRKKELDGLLTGFFEHNGMKEMSLKRINFLHSPTRRSYEYIANLWQNSLLIRKPG